jgi:hypothetical protein
VPLSPELTALLALILGGSGYFFLRRKQHTFLAVALASLLGIGSVAMNARDSIAIPTYEVVLTSGNYATLALPGGYSGPVAVRNTQNFTIVITNIVVGTGYTIQPASVLTVGTQIPPGGVISPALIIAAADTTPPVITLNGAASISLAIGGTYTELGATWTDAVDGSGAVTTITGTVNTAVAGSYTRTYSKTDAAGNTGTATRTVTVSDPTPTGPAAVVITTGDLAGGSPIVVGIALGFSDPLGRVLTFTITGLPIEFTVNPSTGTITGTYDAFGTETLNGTFIATPAGGTHPLVVPLTMTITDQG